MKPLIIAKNLSWLPPLPDAAPLFENLNFSVHRGQCLAIEGESGSGKSTLLRCIIKLEPLQSGTIYWQENRVNKDLIRAFRNRVIYVHQQPIAIGQTVADNLAFPRDITQHLSSSHQSPLTEEEQLQLLDQLGMTHIDFNRDFEHLSLGEKQRLCLIRSMTPRPDVLLLDEPTASLDIKSATAVEELLIDYLAEKPEQRALVWVSHNPEQIKRIGATVVKMADLIGAVSGDR